MIKVSRLIELLQEVPKDADAYAYEGEDIGIQIQHNGKFWFIRAEDEYFKSREYTEGFKDS